MKAILVVACYDAAMLRSGDHALQIAFVRGSPGIQAGTPLDVDLHPVRPMGVSTSSEAFF